MTINTMRIETMLAEQGLTKVAYAARCGISRQNISTIIRAGPVSLRPPGSWRRTWGFPCRTSLRRRDHVPTNHVCRGLAAHTLVYGPGGAPGGRVTYIMGNLCRIPVSATFTVYKGSDTPVMTKAEYADIPADTIARFLLERFGADAIFNGGEGDTH